MASLVLTTLGGAVGGALGGPIGTALGQFGGAFAGGALGLGGAGAGRTGGISVRTTVGPRLTSLGGIASTEGAPIPRVYGRARVGGQMIWATRFFEQVSTTYTPSIGGKGGESAPQPQLSVRVDTTYSYSASFAIGLCEGPIAFVRRVWADGQELDLTAINHRVYHGTEDQEPDPLIAAKEVPGTAPAYRGLAYIVFEWLPIGPFGNRIPQMTFEVVRPVDGLGKQIRAVNIIPGGTEFGYEPTLHVSMPGPGTTVAENRNQLFAQSDWVGSIDALQALCPNLVSVALVVVWFGDDLRAGHCTIAPRVDNTFKTTTGNDWSVAGLSRSSARLVSFVDGFATFGGTPSDASVVGAIADLKARGLSVTLYPFVMMDVRPDNALPDPWSGVAPQPAFPWRGRITCDPAPGVDGSPDGTAAAGAQVDSFFAAYNYRGFVMHCASLAQSAGGVVSFLSGVGLARLRNGAGAPFGTANAGDFWIDTTNSRLYGPYVGPSWPTTYLSLGGAAPLTNLVAAASFATPILPNGSDMTAALNAALATLYAVGGGTVQFDGGTYRFDGAVTLPYDGSSSAPKGVPIAFRGVGEWRSGKSSASAPIGGTQFDIRYSNATGWLRGLAEAPFVADGITFTQKGMTAVTTPFMLFTNTVPMITRCGFEGHSTKTSATADQDCILLGGTDNSSFGGDGVAQPFQGYGAVVERCHFNRVRRGVYGRVYANGIIVRDNCFWAQCGGATAIEFNSGTTDYCVGGVIANNLIEAVGYTNPISLTRGSSWTIVGNNIYDEQALANEAYVKLTSCVAMIVIAGAGRDMVGAANRPYVNDTTQCSVFLSM